MYLLIFLLLTKAYMASKYITEFEENTNLRIFKVMFTLHLIIQIMHYKLGKIYSTYHTSTSCRN